MDLDLAHFLTSPRGRDLLAAARETRDLAAHRRPDALRRLGSGDEIRAALQQDDLRRRGAVRIPDAERLLFTPGALEQATAWPVALERGRRWPGPPDAPLVDLTAGIGLDALAAASTGRPVRAIERDPARVALLRYNAEALGLGERVRVEEADVLEIGPQGGPLAFLDPDRRPGGRRTRDPDGFLPPPEAWDGLLAGFEASMVKLPPVLPEASPHPVEMVSLRGRLRERRELRGRFDAPRRRALRLPAGTAIEGEGLRWPEAMAPEPGLRLLDPDPGVTVLDLVGDLAARDGLRPIHPRISYLIGPQQVAASPGAWVRIEAILPPKPRDIDRWLQKHGVGRLTIRIRGVDETAERWRKRLHPKGSEAGTLVFTRGPDDRWVVLAGREEPTDTPTG